MLAGLMLPLFPVMAAPGADAPEQRYVSSMDTLITLTAYGENSTRALDMAEEEIYRLNDLLSTGREDSEISILNREGSGTLSPDVSAIIKEALSLYESTGGLFDITIYPLMQLWGFAAPETDILSLTPEEEVHSYHVPDEDELQDVLARIGSDRLIYDGEAGTLTLGEGQTIDLGGIAKGYASARLMEIYRQAGLTSGMVSLGGNVQCLNTKPDGSSYKIAIRDPWGSESSYAAVLEIRDEAVITSGGYERYFTDEATGVTYQHIMNPFTGYPVESDLASVSIITKDGMLGDGLSTSLYIMGIEDAVRYWQEHSDEFDMLLIDQEGLIHITEGIEDRLMMPDRYEVIHRS